MNTSPQQQMDSATEALATSLGMSRDELIEQIIRQCLEDVRDDESNRPSQPYVRLGDVVPRSSDTTPTVVIVPEDESLDLEVHHLEGSNG